MISCLDPLYCGVTPHDIAAQWGKVKLLHYKSPAPTHHSASPPFDQPSLRAPLRAPRPPLLIVYSLINRPYLADLQPDRSLVAGLLNNGQDVYLVDWGYPDAVDRLHSLDDYLNRDLHRCVNTICEQHNIEQINLLGICQGGVLSLCYSAMHIEKVRNLVTMVTPVDFQTPDNMLSHWAKNIDVDALVDSYGNVPGQLLNALFMKLRPYQSGPQKYLRLYDSLKDKSKLQNFMQMERWLFDCPDQAGAAFRQFVKAFVQQNGLLGTDITIGDFRIDLRTIAIPVLNIYATQDHLVPPASARALGQLIPGRGYAELAFASGHVGVFVSSKAQQSIPPAIGQWLDEH